MLFIFGEDILMRLKVTELSHKGLVRNYQGEGGWKQLFETAETGGVMKNGPFKGGGSCKYVCVIM